MLSRSSACILFISKSTRRLDYSWLERDDRPSAMDGMLLPIHWYNNILQIYFNILILILPTWNRLVAFGFAFLDFVFVFDSVILLELPVNIGLVFLLEVSVIAGLWGSSSLPESGVSRSAGLGSAYNDSSSEFPNVSFLQLWLMNEALDISEWNRQYLMIQ